VIRLFGSFPCTPPGKRRPRIRRMSSERREYSFDMSEKSTILGDGLAEGTEI